MWKLKIRNTVIQLARAHRTLQSEPQKLFRHFPIFSTDSCTRVVPGVQDKVGEIAREQHPSFLLTAVLGVDGRALQSQHKHDVTVEPVTGWAVIRRHFGVKPLSGPALPEGPR